MKRIWWAAVAAAAAFALPAMAANNASDVTWGSMLSPPSNDRYLNVQGEFGILTYMGGLGDVTGPGSAWGARVGADVTRGFGVEAAYVGSHTAITDPRLEQGSAVNRNGVGGLVKAYAPLQTVRPFGGVGVNATFNNPNNKAEVGNLYQNDWQTEIPFVAGIEVDSKWALAGIRASWSWLGGEDLINNATVRSNNGSLLQANLNVGGRF